MSGYGWFIFALSFALSELVFRKKDRVSAALRGFSGGCLIALVCFFLAPEVFSKNPVITGLLMLAGVGIGECLSRMKACGTALWFVCLILFALGFISGFPFVPMGGGLLLYTGVRIFFGQSICDR